MSRLLLPLLLAGSVSSVYAQEASTPAAAPAADQAPAAKDTSPAEGTQPAAAPATEAAKPAPSPEAVAAKKTFDGLVEKWADLINRIKKYQTDRAAASGDDRTKIDEQIAGLRREADELVGQIANAGLDVYRADADAYPEVNTTLLRIAQHHLGGNANGDGGDQYEKALPLIKGLIKAGAAKRWPELWLWGGVAAYCTNDYKLAKEYLDMAEETGALTAAPPSNDPNDPRVRIWHAGAQYRSSVDRVGKAWEKEKEIRAAEAKADDLPRVKLTTTRGDIVLELFENEAPQAVANFLTLVKQGYYNGLTFHRVLPGFMAQGGDPKGDGSGGPGYAIRDEHNQPNFRHHFRGSLSMAKTQDPNTGGSQFFITFVPTSSLDGKHTCFGRVIEGMDVAASIQRRDPDSGTALPTPDRILKAEVLRDRGHEYTFKKLPER